MNTLPKAQASSEIFTVRPRILFALQIFLGAIFLTLLTQVRIPLQPVPVTLQTFAIFTLAFYYGSSRAAYSVLLFLGAATAGLPVLGYFMSNPLWMCGPTAGYFISFPIAAFVIGKIVEGSAKPSFVRLVCSLLAGQAIIYFLGVSWLSFMVGFEKGITMGLLPFLAVDTLKILTAVSLKMGTTRLL